MRTIRWTARFKRDFRRIESSPLGARRLRRFEAVVEMLANDESLPARFADHPLAGEWIDHRDCHIAPDLVLIYRKANGVIELVRLGSHSELGL